MTSQQKRNLAAKLVVLLSLGLGIYLMKQFGVVGVALATFIGEFLKNALMFALFKRKCHITYDRRIWFSYLMLILSAIALFGFVNFIGENFIVWIVTNLLFGVYFVFYLVNFHALSNNELQKLEDVILSSNKTSKIYRRLAPLLNVVTIKRI